MTEQRVETIEEFNARMEATIADEDQPELPIENESDEVEETEEMDPHVAFDKAKEKFIKRKLVDALFSNECGWVLGNKHPKNKLMKFFWDICLKEDLITTKADGSALRKPKLPYLTKDQTPDGCPISTSGLTSSLNMLCLLVRWRTLKAWDNKD